MKHSPICPVCGRRSGDSRPPCSSCANAGLPVRAAGQTESDSDKEQRRVINAEVLGPENEHGGHDHGKSRFGGRNEDFGGGFNDAESHRAFGGRGLRFGTVWSAGGREQNACLAPCVTFALFLVCLAQFGVLAGIGFVFFHIVGSVAGSMRDMRELMQGRKPNPWFWRMGNWLVSFLLVAWLAGGFD